MLKMLVQKWDKNLWNSKNNEVYLNVGIKNKGQLVNPEYNLFILT